MKSENRATHLQLYIVVAVAGASLVAAASGSSAETTSDARTEAAPGTPGAPYANMPALAPIGVRLDKYLEVPDAAKGPAVDPAKGYRTRKLGDGLYMIRTARISPCS